MQKELREKLDKLSGIIGIQSDSCTPTYDLSSDYMYGMYNGLVLAYSMFDSVSPKFKKPVGKSVRKKKSRIRHKNK